MIAKQRCSQYFIVKITNYIIVNVKNYLLIIKICTIRKFSATVPGSSKLFTCAYNYSNSMRDSCTIRNTLSSLSLSIELVTDANAILNHCGFTYSYTRDERCIPAAVSHKARIWDRHGWTRECFASSERVFDGKSIASKRCAATTTVFVLIPNI